MCLALEDLVTGVYKYHDLRGKRSDYVLDLKTTVGVTGRDDQYNRARIKIVQKKIARRGR